MPALAPAWPGPALPRLVLGVLVLLACTVAQAGMIWKAAAVDPAQVARLAGDGAALRQTLDGVQGGPAVNLDKAWHGLHYLLSGDRWAVRGVAGQAILGGREFGPDLGYGRARVLAPAEVQAIAEALAKEAPAALAARYNGPELARAKIYPEGIWTEPREEALQYLLDFYEPLRRFYREAARRGLAVILAVT